MRQSYKYGWLFVGLLFIVSCRNIDGDDDKLPPLEDTELTEILDSLSSQKFDSFFTKISTEYQDTSRKVSFKTTLRIVTDSALGVSVTYANLPIMSAVITKDSLKLSNKRDKCYVLQSQSYFKETFGVNFTHRNIEEMMMGLPVAFNKKATYYRIKDPFSFTLCSHTEKEAQRIHEEGDKEMIFYYRLDMEQRNLASMRIESPSDTTVVTIDYPTRQLVDYLNVPLMMKVSIVTPRQEIVIEMEYKKPRINEPEEIYFVIPESYGACN